MEGYRLVNNSELHDGDEVIVEALKWENKTGKPKPSEYYRTIVGHHRTVSGDAFHLVSEPSFEYPSIPPWQGRWIYAGNNACTRMWMKEET